MALKPLMMKSPYKDRYIINVSSMEGAFEYNKRTTHPHTNMARAAINMLTRTCGKYYAKFGIFMTCVDTGWVSQMTGVNTIVNSEAHEEKYDREFVNIPLDELDGAMRVIHPIIEGVRNKKYLYGIFLKDYKKHDW